MKEEEKTHLLIVDSPQLPPLADTQNVQPRLVSLSALLEQICENLVESTSAARARGIVETAIRLQLINFDVMESALSQIEEVLLCNTYPTERETPCHPLVKEAFELASDILLDMPLGLGIGENAPSKEELAKLTAEPKPEEESKLIEVTHLRGCIRNLKLLMAGVEPIATFEFAASWKIVAFPRMWRLYRVLIESYAENETYIEIKVQPLKTGDYALLEILGNPLSSVAEKPNFTEGQRVRLTRDLPDFAETHPVNIFKGDEGIVHRPHEGSDLGFLSDRWGDVTHFSRMVDGELENVLDFCEVIEAEEDSND